MIATVPDLRIECPQPTKSLPSVVLDAGSQTKMDFTSSQAGATALLSYSLGRKGDAEQAEKPFIESERYEQPRITCLMQQKETLSPSACPNGAIDVVRVLEVSLKDEERLGELKFGVGHFARPKILGTLTLRLFLAKKK